ncbi:hypothetical protein AC578_4013 [Pseudocercospora eumusae]|uniref:Uncharacterized protein n=1 Tax=Pseudocercospora eumusae TaxID=321146 RepID=A0A139HLJ3_9PEZI|nr:hypothetical protein AC578_4013 [Pseudocercospora eumusae]
MHLQYDIKQSQDECMLTLIRYFEDSALRLQDNELNEILGLLPSRSELARLLKICGRLSGEAQRKLIDNSAYHFGDRLEKALNRPHWTEYMMEDLASWPVERAEKT